MSFLDSLKKTAGIAAQVTAAAADTAVSKTRTMASIGRVKLAISSEEDKLKKSYIEMGRLFYRDYQAQAEADMTEYQPWCDRAADARAQIQRLTQELELLKAEGKDLKEEPAEKVSMDENDAEPQVEEDMSIFADLDEPEATEATEAVQEPEIAEEQAEEVPAQEEFEAPDADSDVVGTFYLDISGEDAEV